MSRSRNSARVRMRVAASPTGSDPRAGGPPSLFSPREWGVGSCESLLWCRPPHFLFGPIDNALCYLLVGVKKAVHPIRFASDSRIALLAAVLNPHGSDRLPAQAGATLHKVQSVSAAAPFLVPAARVSSSATIKIARSPLRARASDGLVKAPAKNEERGPLPGPSDGRLFHD